MPVQKGASLDPARTRSLILHHAIDLFYERGLDGVGVAELCRTIGVSKETLYRHFGSKDGLIDAVVQARSDRVSEWLVNAADLAGPDPSDRLAAVFDALGAWYAEPTFRGCAVINAATQRHGKPVADVAERHLDRYRDLLTDIALAAGADDSEVLGQQLLMLLEGATTVADHHKAGRAAADHAKLAALTLLACSSRT